MISDEIIITRTKHWLQSFVVNLNLCPFAKREIERNSLKIIVSDATDVQQALEALLLEFLVLDNDPAVETTLLVFSKLFNDFYDYLDFVDFAELLLQDQKYEGIYQVATFHPQYFFATTEPDDVTNYTNRSPYPMLHLLREESLDKAITYYGDTEKIIENNMSTLRALGLSGIKKLL